MQQTTYLNLDKPEAGVDRADISIINANMDTLDITIHGIQEDVADKQNALTPGTGIEIQNDTISVDPAVVSDIEANPAETATDILTKLGVGGTIYEVSGGGGTTVVPNPTGTPTQTLNTIGIDNVIYDIAGSGGGYKDEVIYEDTTGATGVQNITLTERLDKYDAVYFEFYFPSETTYVGANPTPLQRIVETPTGASNKYFVQSYPSYGNRYILLESTDGGTSATLTTSAWGESIYPSVYRIHGVEFGNGSSGSDKELLYTLEQGQRWETFPNPNSEYPLIIEACGGGGVIARVEVDVSKLPSREGGDNYVTVCLIPNAQGQSVNMATNNNNDTIYISTSATYSPTMYVKVYESVGVSMVHYDSNEKVVGTYFGKTLYEKSYQNIAGTGTNVNVTLSDLSDIEAIFIVSEASASTDEIPFPYLHPSSANIIGGFFSISNGVPTLNIRRGSDASAFGLKYLTVRYTKTTA